MHEAEFRRCLEKCDAAGVRRIWARVQPNLPQPQNDAHALVALHMARTASEAMALRLRAYSHRWLLDQGYPSQLPDHLKPRAERLYPRSEKAVGISVNSKYPVVQRAIHGAMQAAALEAIADGHMNEPVIVKARMMEARAREQKGLGRR
jgi:hypothetical protein